MEKPWACASFDGVFFRARAGLIILIFNLVLYVGDTRLSIFCTSQDVGDVMLRVFVIKTQASYISQRRGTALRVPPIIPSFASTLQHWNPFANLQPLTLPDQGIPGRKCYNFRGLFVLLGCLILHFTTQGNPILNPNPNPDLNSHPTPTPSPKPNLWLPQSTTRPRLRSALFVSWKNAPATFKNNRTW